MFPFLQIKRYRDFNKNILPKIDALAAEQNRTRSDVIRDILYGRFGYIPLSRSPEQVNEDHAAERQEGKSLQHCCVIVRVDKEYKDMFFKYILTQPGGLERNYRRYLNQTLYHYFDMAVPGKLQ
jgi:predicted GTPase